MRTTVASRSLVKAVPWIMLGLFSSMTAYGSHALEGQLRVPHFMYDGYVVVVTDGQRSSSNPCSSTYQDRFAVDATSPAGKAQLAGLLSAHATGKRVRIVEREDVLRMAKK